jgi:23S rRNA-/tRNA-specific pseudouridylate synthase
MSTEASISASDPGRGRTDAEPPGGWIPEARDFDPETILFYGHGLLAVNKPAGVPVHKGTGHERGVLEALAEWVSLNPRVLGVRPGKAIHSVHRLDLEASGVLLFAFGREMARRVQSAFEEGRVRKAYLAVISGPMPESGRLRGKVRSKLRGVWRRVPAELSYRRLRGDDRLSVVEVKPKGGRSHQIRVLFEQAGRPLAGDLRYGKPKPSRQFLEKFALPHFLLHALELELPEEVLGAPKTLSAPVPAMFQSLCRQKGWAEI